MTSTIALALAAAEKATQGSNKRPIHRVKPGETFERFDGSKFLVNPDGSFRRINKPLSRRKLRRLDAQLRANGSSFAEMREKLIAIKNRMDQPKVEEEAIAA